MKANELRAGNLIGLRNGAVVELSLEMIVTLLQKQDPDSLYFPLPVNSEWLLKLGFAETKEGYFVLTSYPGFQLKQNGDEFEVLLQEQLLFSKPLTIHRLQNLVYELTDEELILIEEEDELAEAIQMVADGILYQYLPSDPSVEELNFNLSIEGETYIVSYRKDKEGYWGFAGYRR